MNIIFNCSEVYSHANGDIFRFKPKAFSSPISASLGKLSSVCSLLIPILQLKFAGERDISCLLMMYCICS